MPSDHNDSFPLSHGSEPIFSGIDVSSVMENIMERANAEKRFEEVKDQLILQHREGEKKILKYMMVWAIGGKIIDVRGNSKWKLNRDFDGDVATKAYVDGEFAAGVQEAREVERRLMTGYNFATDDQLEEILDGSEISRSSSEAFITHFRVE